MSQFRLARLAVLLAAVGLAPALTNTALAQKKGDKPAPAAEQKGPTVRPELYKLVDPAQIKPLVDAKNFTEVENRTTQAAALPNLTPYETYVIHRTKLQLAVSSNNDALTISSLEAIINSEFAPAAEKDNLMLALANLYDTAKNYPKEAEWLKRYMKESATPEKARSNLIRALYLSGDYASTKTEVLPVIAESEKSGVAPTDQDLRLLASSASKLKDDATYLAAMEKLVAFYPTDDYWTDVINRGIQRRPGFDGNAHLIEVYRFEFAAVKKMAPEDYMNLAELALQVGSPTEAKQALDAGFAAGVLSDAKARQLRDKANKSAADDAKNIASGEASAAKSKNGAGLVNIGWAYVTMGQYDKGINFIEQGIAKGSLKQPDEAKLRLGMALAKAGRKDDAIKTFQTVKAGGGLSDLAKYWIVLLNHPTGAPGLQVAAQ
ncbi:tetratricopeptide repeat protein [Massilia horti]|uniref:Tetratricopeptide repeat protein n=1 Tax=Massilia horti TaxID=2562153 RepID=A0A4Y9SVN9_9BURK|nr:tetratricopeptide repeat protein [Massilia horti]TFW29577.1 hypothetical protein E4O92_18715 [Massilia horti]